MDTFLNIVTATLYHVCEPILCVHTRLEDAPPGVKLLYEATKEAHGGLVTISPVLPGLITSTDDLTVYHCVEKNHGFSEFLLVKGPTGA
jgi:hypothetical protein